MTNRVKLDCSDRISNLNFIKKKDMIVTRNLIKDYE